MAGSRARGTDRGSSAHDTTLELLTSLPLAMHQQYYEDLVTREHILPVSGCTPEGYYGMVAILREFRPHDDFTGSLRCSSSWAFAPIAPRSVLELSLKPPRSARRTRLVSRILPCPTAANDRRYPRYGELLARRAARRHRRTARRCRGFRPTTRDLQYAQLAWIDPLYRDNDPRIRALVAKGRGFSETTAALRPASSTAEQRIPESPAVARA